MPRKVSELGLLSGGRSVDLLPQLSFPQVSKVRDGEGTAPTARPPARSGDGGKENTWPGEAVRT